jgi:Flp pilus assembly protein TadG
MTRRPLIRRRREAGSVAVEMAVTLSALLLLIVGAVEFSLPPSASGST